MTNAIILNGPPGSGKDTIAQLLVQETAFGKAERFQQFEFKHELYRCTAEYFQVELDDFITQATDGNWKEKIWPPLSHYSNKGNLIRTFTPREALIHVSEDIIKPSHGADYFGQAAVRSVLAAQAANAVFSDGGFKEEIRPLIESCDRVFIFHLCREGFTFDGDSRDYIIDYPNISYALELIEDSPMQAVNSILHITNPVFQHQQTA